MIVVNSNVIANLYIPGNEDKLSQQVFLKDSDWLAPPLWESEILNVLLLHIRKDLLSLGNAKIIIRHIQENMDHRTFSVNSDIVLNIAAGSKCTVHMIASMLALS